MATTPRRRQPAPANKKPRTSYVRYSPKLGQAICQRLAQGEVWARICEHEQMPAYATLYSWRDRYPEFAEALARAREMAADFFADRVMEVAEGATSATASGDRIRVGALQWRAAKAAPHLYGRKAEDRVEPRKIIVTVRQFEKAVGPDGQTYLREIPKMKEGRR
jgi:hypothetical protein